MKQMHMKEERYYFYACSSCKAKATAISEIYYSTEPNVPPIPYPDNWQMFYCGSEDPFILCGQCSTKYRRRLIDLRVEIMSPQK